MGKIGMGLQQVMLNLDLNWLEVITLFPEFIIYLYLSGGIFKDKYLSYNFFPL